MRLWGRMRKLRPKSVGRGKSQARRTTSGTSTLVNRNVRIGGRRTSMRLEPAMWDALEEICQRENLTHHEMCGNIDRFRHASSLTAAVRVFIVNYYRAAANEVGHADIGHGALYKAKARDGRT